MRDTYDASFTKVYNNGLAEPMMNDSFVDPFKVDQNMSVIRHAYYPNGKDNTYLGNDISLGLFDAPNRVSLASPVKTVAYSGTPVSVDVVPKPIISGALVSPPLRKSRYSNPRNTGVVAAKPMRRYIVRNGVSIEVDENNNPIGQTTTVATTTPVAITTEPRPLTTLVPQTIVRQSLPVAQPIQVSYIQPGQQQPATTMLPQIGNTTSTPRTYTGLPVPPGSSTIQPAQSTTFTVPLKGSQPSSGYQSGPSTQGGFQQQPTAQQQGFQPMQSQSQITGATGGGVNKPMNVDASGMPLVIGDPSKQSGASSPYKPLGMGVNVPFQSPQSGKGMGGKNPYMQNDPSNPFSADYNIQEAMNTEMRRKSGTVGGPEDLEKERPKFKNTPSGEQVQNPASEFFAPSTKNPFSDMEEAYRKDWETRESKRDPSNIGSIMRGSQILKRNIELTGKAITDTQAHLIEEYKRISMIDEEGALQEDDNTGYDRDEYDFGPTANDLNKQLPDTLNDQKRKGLTGGYARKEKKVKKKKVEKRKADPFVRALNYKGNPTQEEIDADDLSSEDHNANEREVPIRFIVPKKKENEAQVIKDTVEKIEKDADGEIAKLRDKETKRIVANPVTMAPTGQPIPGAAGAGVMNTATGISMIGQQGSGGMVSQIRTRLFDGAMPTLLAGIVLGTLIFTILYLITN